MGKKFNRTKESALTSDKLRHFLAYDAETGDFRWNVTRSKGRPAGSLAGGLSKATGYVKIMLNGASYPAHRLAWLYVYGRWPTNEIDHINGNKADNRVSNLREATSSQNTINRRILKSNKSGVRGVRFYPPRQKWHARIMINRTQKHLGYFDTIETAEAAYRAAQIELHGAFAHSGEE